MMKGSRKMVVWIVPLILVAVAAVVLAQSEEGAVAYRQRIMSANGASMGAINDILKFKLAVSNEHIAAHAETIHRESLLVADAFKAQVTAGETRALPEIWQRWDEFVAAADAMGQASAKLAEVARAGDPQAVMAGVREVGATCGGCHDVFRKPNE